MYFVILAIGVLLVVAQGIGAYCDGWFCQSQMSRLGHQGYAFIEHGGMWADIVVVSPAVALIVSQYKLSYLSWWSVCILVVIIAFTVWCAFKFAQMGEVTPEAHTHDGVTTMAGWIHVLYAAVAMWVFVLFLITPTAPQVSVQDLLLVATALTILFPLGVIKFNPNWSWMPRDTVQTIVMTGIVWTATGIKMFLMK